MHATHPRPPRSPMHAMPSGRTSPRGSTLIITILVMLIMAVISVGVLRISSRETAGARSAALQEGVVACAEAGRALLLSRFHVLGVKPTELTALDVRLDGTNGEYRAVGGHIDTLPTATITQVEALPPQSVRSQGSINEGGDITNLVRDVGGSAGTGGLGGTPLKITVHCQQGDTSTATSGRQYEIEYAVRFGL